MHGNCLPIVDISGLSSRSSIKYCLESSGIPTILREGPCVHFWITVAFQRGAICGQADGNGKDVGIY